MIDKDPIEELFRNEMEKTISEEKPREIVWQKIEKELKPKSQKHYKFFVNNIWFSAAVFALIAVPYFYFFIENLNQQEDDILIKREFLDLVKNDTIKNNEFVYEPVVHQQEQVSKIKDENLNKLETPSVKENHSLKDEVANDWFYEESQDSISNPIVMAASYSSPKNYDKLDSLTFAGASTEKAQKRQAKKDASQNTEAPKEPIVFYRNRIELREEINHVSFYFISNVNNKLTFERNGKKIFIIRKNGIVKVSTNTDKMKKELLDLVIKNKEQIFNYYVNL